MPPKGRKKSAQAASSSKRTKRATAQPEPPSPPLPWPLATPNQIKRYTTLAKRIIIPSKFFDMFTIQRLGLEQEVSSLLDNIGWTTFASIQFPTYTEVTYEILSTVEAKYNPYDSHDPGTISFRCLGIDRELTLSELNLFFGFPNEALQWTIPSFVPNLAWNSLTGRSQYNPSQSKATFLRSHALRYIHRVMSMSLFGRGESTGVVNKVELMFLWAMTNNIKINTGVWLLKHLLHVSRTSAGKICIGGLLSVIANAYGFIAQPEIHHVVAGSHLVDIDTLLNMRACKHTGGGCFRLLDRSGHVLQHEDPEEEADADYLADEQPMDFPDVDLSGFPTAFPEHQHETAAGPSSSSYPDPHMAQIMERFEHLETRMSRSEEIQMQMLQMLQQNAKATARIENKLSKLK